MKFPDSASTLLCVIDIQEKLVPAISSFEEMIPRQQLMLHAATELKLRTIINEQYPRGLGNTISPIRELFLQEWPVIEKSSFSAFGSDAFRTELAKFPVKSIALIGIEAHVCVQQTAFDALNSGLNVFVLADATGSRKSSDKDLSLDFMRSKGINVTSVESFLFMLMKESSHPAFKAVSKLLR